ncbi:MAG: F0F1 ATP synthase subunit A [Acholeplasmatales bacterium]|nr:MAG: F0F1 ATP synthase subunit A [Acholeplasmatales bacterium]
MIDFYEGLSQNLKASLLVIVGLIVFLTVFGKKAGNLDPRDKPRGVLFVLIFVVDTINNFIRDFYGTKWRTYAPILTAIFLYLAFANTASLFGLAAPLANMSIALSFSAIAFFTIQISGIIVRNPLNRLKDLSSPNVLLLPLNLVGEISTPVAMGLRLFGNLLSGSVMAVVVYNLLDPFSSTLITLAVLHPIFNIGFGLIQAMVYFMLLTIFLSMAIEEPEVAPDKS